MAPSFALGRAIPPKRAVEFALHPNLKKALVGLGLAGGTAAYLKQLKDDYKKSKEEGLPSKRVRSAIGAGVGLAGGALAGRLFSKHLLEPDVMEGRKAAKKLINLYDDLVTHGGMTPAQAKDDILKKVMLNPGFSSIPREVSEGRKAKKLMDTAVPAFATAGTAYGAQRGYQSAKNKGEDIDDYAKNVLAGEGHEFDPEDDIDLSRHYFGDDQVPLATRRAALESILKHNSGVPVSYGKSALEGGAAMALPVGALLGLRAGLPGALAGTAIGLTSGAGIGLLNAALEKAERREVADLLESGDKKKLGRLIDKQLLNEIDFGDMSPSIRKGSKRRQEYLKSSMKKQSSVDSLALFRMLAPA